MTDSQQPGAFGEQQIKTLMGQNQGPSAWRQITQAQVNQFADLTGDHQFIHIEPELAAKTPFGGTIVHGFMLLSLLPTLLATALPTTKKGRPFINYGLDSVRFLQAVPVGSQVRASQQVIAVSRKNSEYWRVKSRVTLEVRGLEDAALVAELITLVPHPDSAPDNGQT